MINTVMDLELTLVKERIERILRSERLSASQFADEIGVQRPNVSHILSGRNNPSLEFVQKVLTRFKQINADWLLFGKGDMYRGGQASLFSQPQIFNQQESSQTIESNAQEASFPLPVDPQINENVSNMRVNDVKFDISKEIETSSHLDQTEFEAKSSNQLNIPPTIPPLAQTLSQIAPTTKKVKQIIVLYTDNTCAVYDSE